VADKETKKAPETAPVEKVAVEVLHPIAHGAKLFGRGIHHLEEDVAGIFVGLKDPVSKKPIAQYPKEKEAALGTVEDAPGAKK